MELLKLMKSWSLKELLVILLNLLKVFCITEIFLFFLSEGGDKKFDDTDVFKLFESKVRYAFRFVKYQQFGSFLSKT